MNSAKTRSFAKLIDQFEAQIANYFGRFADCFRSAVLSVSPSLLEEDELVDVCQIANPVPLQVLDHSEGDVRSHDDHRHYFVQTNPCLALRSIG